MKTKRTLIGSIALATIAVAGITTTAIAKGGGGVEAGMVGVPDTMLLANGNIRGVNGGGLPWGIGESKVELKSGKLEVAFEDLVFTAGPNTGKNTIPSMAVVVSCLDANNQAVNVKTDPFPVTVASATDNGGDGYVETSVDLPSPCFAPIVMVTNATGAVWFAVDGL